MKPLSDVCPPRAIPDAGAVAARSPAKGPLYPSGLSDLRPPKYSLTPLRQSPALSRMVLPHHTPYVTPHILHKNYAQPDHESFSTRMSPCASNSMSALLTAFSHRQGSRVLFACGL